MHYLITGHTGFKGSWLTLWLTSLGHKVSGIALDPLPGDLYEIAKVSDFVSNDLRIDIRNQLATKEAINKISPDVIFHMAAQPLVRESYRDPRGTVETNVMGTLNVLEAVSKTPSIQAQVIITTDKVYRNVNKFEGYVESDPLGGEDPYSASKAMADILTQSWVSSFESPPTTIVRAGNVIGGGDFSNERLIPDLYRSITENNQPTLRYPEAVRPWQHVLDCLNSYILIADHLSGNNKLDQVNVGPEKINQKSVKDVASQFLANFDRSASWANSESDEMKESNFLTLDSTRARQILEWADKLKFEEAIEWTSYWYEMFSTGNSPQEITLNQIKKFLEIN